MLTKAKSTLSAPLETTTVFARPFHTDGGVTQNQTFYAKFLGYADRFVHNGAPVGVNKKFHHGALL
jgi:hypothetical protein